MKTSHFDAIDKSRLPPARWFYETQGLKLGRGSGRNNWVSAHGSPPCHHSESKRSFSVNIANGGFKCFGCGATGDIITYVQLRDHCDFQTAAKTLGIWRTGLTEQERLDIRRREQEHKEQQEREAIAKEQTRQRRVECARQIHQIETRIREFSADIQRIGTLDGPRAEVLGWGISSLLDDMRDEAYRYGELSGTEPIYV